MFLRGLLLGLMTGAPFGVVVFACVKARSWEHFVYSEIVKYLREIAHTCTRLARACPDLVTSHGLEEVAVDLMAKARQLEDDLYLGFIRRLQTRETADQLRTRILSYLASERQPEFSGINIVRRRSDVGGRISELFAAYLRNVLLR